MKIFGKLFGIVGLVVCLAGVPLWLMAQDDWEEKYGIGEAEQDFEEEQPEAAGDTETAQGEEAEVEAEEDGQSPAAASDEETPPESAYQRRQATVPRPSPVGSPTSFGGGAAAGPDGVEVTSEQVYLNASEIEIQELIKQIAQATGKNFLIPEKLRGKVSIISEKPMTRDMAYQAFLSALQVMGYTTVDGPGGLVKIVATKGAVENPLEIFSENSPFTDKFITRIIPMENVSAMDMSTVLKTLVSKEGNLFAYPGTNTLIVTDAGTNIDRILKIVKELDQVGPQEVLELIPLVNADASDMAEVVQQIFEQQDQQQGSSRARATRRRTQELEEVPNISKILPEERTNSLIVLASKKAILRIRALIAKLDVPLAGPGGKINVYYLKNAVATEMAEVLSNLTAESGSAAKKGGKKEDEVKASVAEFESGVKVAADESTNALVITASPKDYETLVSGVIQRLDIPRRQVYLEAIVMELSVARTRDIGIRGQGGTQFGLSGETITGFGQTLGGTNTILSDATALGGLAGGIISNRTINFTLSDGSSISVPAIGAVINMLQVDTDVNVLATPSILTLDNEEAEIIVGEQVPVETGTTVTDGGVSQTSVTYEDVAISLKITPQINESDTVRLEINQEIKDIAGTGINDNPIFSNRSVTTTVVARDKQTIVIGGLLDDNSSMSTTKVPFLGDIPILGNLFKTTSTAKERRNILVFITPYIIRDRNDYLAILQKKIEERNLFIEQNYGQSQRDKIRDSIRNHASQLLEYKEYARAQEPYPYYPESTAYQTTEQGLIESPTLRGSPASQDYESYPATPANSSPYVPGSSGSTTLTRPAPTPSRPQASVAVPQGSAVAAPAPSASTRAVTTQTTTPTYTPTPAATYYVPVGRYYGVESSTPGGTEALERKRFRRRSRP